MMVRAVVRLPRVANQTSCDSAVVVDAIETGARERDVLVQSC